MIYDKVFKSFVNNPIGREGEIVVARDYEAALPFGGIGFGTILKDDFVVVAIIENLDSAADNLDAGVSAENILLRLDVSVVHNADDIAHTIGLDINV